MPRPCSELITNLQTVKEIQDNLNEGIADYFTKQESASQNTTERLNDLRNIYDTRKALIKTPLLKERIKFAVADKRIWSLVLDKEYHEIKVENLAEFFNHIKDKSREGILPIKRELDLYYGFLSPNPSLLSLFKDLRKNRDKDVDMPILFECQLSEIVHNEEELRQAIETKSGVKAYVGELFNGIFSLLPESIEHIYCTKTQTIIRKKEIKFDKSIRSAEDCKKKFEQYFSYASIAGSIIDRINYNEESKQSARQVVLLTLEDMGFEDDADISEIRRRASELGLEACSSMAGINLRLQYLDQSVGEDIMVPVKSIGSNVLVHAPFILYHPNPKNLVLGTFKAINNQKYYRFNHVAFALPDNNT